MVFRCLEFLRLLICYLVAEVEWFAMKKILLQFVLGSTKICFSFTGLILAMLDEMLDAFDHPLININKLCKFCEVNVG